MRLRILSLWHETVKPVAKQPMGVQAFRKIADL